MVVGIEFLLIAILSILFSNGGIETLVFSILSVGISIAYYLSYLREYKKLTDEEKIKRKSQISYRLIIVSIMIFTINLVHPMYYINMIFGYTLLIYFVVIFIMGIVKKNLIHRKHFMNFNYAFDYYCVLSLITILVEILNYAV